jgi:hypothetical protein
MTVLDWKDIENLANPFFFFPKKKILFHRLFVFTYLFFVLAKKKYDKKLENQLYKTVCLFLKKMLLYKRKKE